MSLSKTVIKRLWEQTGTVDEFARAIEKHIEAARRTVSGQEAAWIRMDHLRQAQQAPFMCRVEPSFRPGLDLVPVYLAAPIPATEQEKP